VYFDVLLIEREKEKIIYLYIDLYPQMGILNPPPRIIQILEENIERSD
jgi:hypothetical protein